MDDSYDLDITQIKDVVQEYSDVELFLRISQPFRLHDQIVITFPTHFDLSEVTDVWSEFGGNDTFRDEYLASADEKWNQNQFCGRYLRQNYTGYMDKYYSDVPASEKTKYHIPLSCKIDHAVVGNVLTVYGFTDENDPRRSVTDGTVNHMVILLRVHNVHNPNAAYKGKDLDFYIQHNRYTYKSGPLLTVHETANALEFEDNMHPAASKDHSCVVMNDYGQDIWPDDIVLFVKCSAVLTKPAI